jgi:hypothetical protein
MHGIGRADKHGTALLLAAIKGGRCVTMELGQVFDKMSASTCLRIPFIVEAYMGIKMAKGLYVWELDDDSKAN